MPEQYIHRNGETEPPTERGLYWYEGEYFVDEDPEPNIYYRLYAVRKNVNDRSGDKWWAFRWNGHPQDRAKNTHEMSGKWWGPVTPPWEEKNG